MVRLQVGNEDRGTVIAKARVNTDADLIGRGIWLRLMYAAGVENDDIALRHVRDMPDILIGIDFTLHATDALCLEYLPHTTPV